MASLSSVELRRNQVATLSRYRPGSPELVDARRDLAAEKIAAYVARVVADAPPLTDAQRDRLARLLQAGAA
jgi:hypothetical protein